MLSYTIAEMTLVQTFSSSGNFLTQGFQQPEGLFLSIPERPMVSGDILIYPNPSNGNFTLSYNSPENLEASIRIYDLLGQIVMTKNVSFTAGANTVNFDITHFGQGNLFLAIPMINSKGEKKTVYNKINLVN